MSADIVNFPWRDEPRQAHAVTIHCELDGTAIVAMKPCPPGEIPRRKFASQDDAWPYADALAKRHATVFINGVGGQAVTVSGPEDLTGTPERHAPSDREADHIWNAAIEEAAKRADPPLMHRKGAPGLWRQRRAAIATGIRALKRPIQ